MDSLRNPLLVAAVTAVPYGTISSYYTYPARTIDVACAADRSDNLQFLYDAVEIPNSFTVKDCRWHIRWVARPVDGGVMHRMAGLGDLRFLFQPTGSFSALAKGAGVTYLLPVRRNVNATEHKLQSKHGCLVRFGVMRMYYLYPCV